MKARVCFYKYQDMEDRLQIYFDANDLMAKVDGLQTKHYHQSVTMSIAKVNRHRVELHIGKAPGRPMTFLTYKSGDRFRIETNANLTPGLSVLPPIGLTVVEATIDGNVITVPLPANPVAVHHTTPRRKKSDKPVLAVERVTEGTVSVLLRDRIIDIPATVADFIVSEYSR